MYSIKYSELLEVLIQEAKQIGNRGIAPFTAERFIVASINKLEEIGAPFRTEELGLMETILNKALLNLESAKNELLLYINNDQTGFFLDDLYMRNQLRELAKIAQNENMEVIDGACLLYSIFENPSDSLKKILDKINPERKIVGLFDDILRENGIIDSDNQDVSLESEYDTDDDFEDEDSEANANGSLSDLIAEVKKIRSELKNYVYGQDHAINVFASGYFQARMLNMTDKNRVRPAATFLFAGPPGVGKTFFAEKAAACLGLPFMRFDMSEYSDKEATIEFCGSDSVYKNAKAGNVTSFVAENPKCILLFDEIEKAHINVIHLFLQMLDAGRLRDSHLDTEVSFRDAVIILTTNAGKQLYEESETGNFSGLSRKVIIRALQKDVDPRTQVPFFPGAMCSRFAAGNVVMFNHISAQDLCTIAENELKRHAANFENQLGIKIDIDEKVFAALLFSEGASADARTIRGRSESFFNDELFELLRLVTSEKSSAELEELKRIHITVDFDRTVKEIVDIFDSGSKPQILILSSENNVELMSRKAPEAVYISAQSYESAVEIIKKDEVDLILLDMRFGATIDEYLSLNIEDAYTPSREFLNYLRTSHSDFPVYVLEDEDTVLTDEEKISFVSKGVRGIIELSESSEKLSVEIGTLSSALHRQASMKALARQNKLIAFSTAQSVTKNGDAEIRLFDFRMEVAVDSEDSKNVLSALSKPNVRFDEIIGAGDAKKELNEFINYLKNPKQYAGTGLRAPKGILLYGPPGTGKTMLAKAMASESDMTFIAAEGNQFLKKYVGEGSDIVHKLFKTARKYAPAILFVDEIEAIAKERKGGDHSGAGGEDVLTSFLTEMDGFSTDPTKPVFVIAATNFDVEPGTPRSLDPALLRRFDRRIYIGLPGKDDRIRFLNMKRENLLALNISDEAIENIAIRSTGMSLASLDSVIDFALRIAIREGKKQVTDDILEEAFETFNYGEAKKWDISELERIARHEAGHALLCYLSGETPSYLTIVARGNHGGYMQHSDNEGKGIYTLEDLLARIRTSLGGRAAEIVCYGKAGGISTGASGDLASATATAMRIVCNYGMDDEFGPAVFDGAPTPEVRAAVNKILREQMEESIRIISENRTKLDALVESLLLKSSMTAADIEGILKN